MLLNAVKTALRISHSKLDDEIMQHIRACIDDMKRLGIAVPEYYDLASDIPLLLAAIKLYCMAQFDFLGKGEQYKKGYESLRDVLSMSSDYKGSDINV